MNCWAELRAAEHIIAERDRRIAELEAELATLRETCRRWERLCRVTMHRNHIYFVGEVRIEASREDGVTKYRTWKAGMESGEYDSPLDALAAIEQWEAEQKGEQGCSTSSPPPS